MGYAKKDLLTQLAQKCKTEGLVIVKERCGIFVMWPDRIIPVYSSAEIPSSRDILVELHIGLEGKWSALFFATFQLDSNRRIFGDEIKLEKASNALDSEKDEIQAHGEALWKLLKELIENDP